MYLQPQHKIVTLLHVHSVAVFRELFIVPEVFFFIVLAVIVVKTLFKFALAFSGF